MNCQHCQEPLEPGVKKCPTCSKKRRKLPLGFLSGILVATALFLFLNHLFSSSNEPTTTSNPETEVTVVQEEELLDRTALVAEAQKIVYTLFTKNSQGSAFLYDDQGHVVTNAHVVEGNLEATVKNVDGKELQGKVIGYSNEIDIALLSVPELKGEEPFPLEKEKESEIGEEVIALGTPLGLENTATFGYITGVNRTFNIPPHEFKNVYQISAPVEPGNSGGPLLSIDRKKIIAVNAAKSVEAGNIAFSIPLHQIVDLIDQWIASPMNEEEITALFYNEDGDYYYDFLWSLFEYYYFGDGDFDAEEEYEDFWFFDDYYDEWNDFYDPLEDNEDYDDWEEWEDYDDYEEDIDDDFTDEYDFDDDYDFEEEEDLEELEEWYFDDEEQEDFLYEFDEFYEDVEE